ncbi:endonuclease MutS2 [Alkalibacter mobilis]|uniref:endonuclease MutS2 n=1 Tax=Alkalibacter mobilis TaxID=2787712 RepID=UPI00189FC31C|nr:endonuclease MutS2 [Alkalibacter mobilis]MBF7095783.1 endonuclease MutS2 [Alkalibacter mobilis]
MNKRALKVLEYDKILNILSSFAQSQTAKDEIMSLVPSADEYEINKMLDETDQGTIVLFKNGNIPMAPFKDIRNSIKRASINSILTLSEFLAVRDFLKIIWDLIKYFEKLENSEIIVPAIHELFDSLDPLVQLRKSIENAILSEDEISDSASPELFRIRREINRKNAQIREKLNSMISSSAYQKHLQDNIITIRQDRYVIPVKQESRGSVPGIVHDQSSSGATLFIEPMAIVELNNNIRTLRMEESREIEKILLELTILVGDNEISLKFNYDIMVHLDVVFAKSRYALEINGSRPRSSQNKVLDLKQCRHPLIPKDQVVASDIRIGKDYSVLIVTGPNTGGKTVALKTTGLLSLMYQTGMFIPVKEDSEICVFKSVYADIGDEQSIEQSLSTFSSHMSNIVKIVEEADENSLVLFDELGAGTDPVEGAALAMSILDFLYNKGSYCMVTTHYSELKQYALSTAGMENASVEFDVNTLSPTYRLTIGIPGKSNAFEISARLGLNKNIIENANMYLTEDTLKFEDVIKDIQENQKKAARELEDIEKIKKENSSLTEYLEIEKRKLEENKQKIKDKAREEALEIITEAKEAASSIIKEMQSIKSKNIKDSFKELEHLRKNLKEKEDDIYSQFESKAIGKKSVAKQLKNLKPGDDVLIKSMNQKAIVVSKPDKDGNTLVEAGIMKLRVHLSDLIKVEPEENKKTYSTKSVAKKAAAIKSSIDVRGMTSEDVIMDVEKYLDDATLANLKVVTIVHGKGTGVLRKTIQDLLKRNRNVEDFRLGGYNEGGDGATIVTLK